MFTETEIFLILLILCSIIVNVVLYFMWNIATKKFSELQKQYIDYLNKEIIQFTTNAISNEFPIDDSKSMLRGRII